jgi:excisionase family DNA binding protein
MKRFLKKRELARHYGVSLRTVDKWVAQRKVPYLKIGYIIRFDLDKVEAALARFTYICK